MRVKRVKFLRYFNRPRLILGIEMDTFAVFVGVLFLLYIAFTLTASVNAFVQMMISFFAGLAAAYYYERYKNEAPKSILSHILYVYNIRKIKTGKKKFQKEVESMDLKPEKYFPTPNERFFME